MTYYIKYPICKVASADYDWNDRTRKHCGYTITVIIDHLNEIASDCFFYCPVCDKQADSENLVKIEYDYYDCD